MDLDARSSAAVRRVLHSRCYAPNWVTGGDAPEWMAAAVCASTDPEAFFPEKGGSAREAKRVCRGDGKKDPGCPVRAECLAYALEHVERFGIWGGLSERERRRLLVPSANRPQPRPDDAGICPVCGFEFRSVAKHRARKANCRAEVAA